MTHARCAGPVLLWSQPGDPDADIHTQAINAQQNLMLTGQEVLEDVAQVQLISTEKPKPTKLLWVGLGI
jgi:hypothetical protein